MISKALFLALLVWALWLVRKYKLTGDQKHLKSAGALVIAGSFFPAFAAGVDAVLYPEKARSAYTILTVGVAAGTLLMAAGYPGWRKILAILQGGFFLWMTAFLISCLPYFGRPFVAAHAYKECAKIVPGVSLEGLQKMGAPEKAALAPKLAAALDSDNAYARLGALYSLAYMPEEAAVALPRLVKLLETAEEDHLTALLSLIKAMGPAAAPAIPVLETRMAAADSYLRYRYDEVIKAVRPILPETGHAAEIKS